MKHHLGFLPLQFVTTYIQDKQAQGILFKETDKDDPDKDIYSFGFYAHIVNVDVADHGNVWIGFNLFKTESNLKETYYKVVVDTGPVTLDPQVEYRIVKWIEHILNRCKGLWPEGHKLSHIFVNNDYL